MHIRAQVLLIILQLGIPFLVCAQLSVSPQSYSWLDTYLPESSGQSQHEILPLEKWAYLSDEIYSSFLYFGGTLAGENSEQVFPNRAGHSPSIFIPKDHLAFFCRIELHLEKATRMPIKFRLGSVDYVDRLEGKRAW